MCDIKHLLGLLITAIIIALVCLAGPPTAVLHGRAGDSGEPLHAVRPYSI